MREILRLAVALIQPRENSQYLGRTLRRQDRISLGEGGHIERGIGFAPQFGVRGEELQLQIVGHVDASVLPERRDVIGGMAKDAVLEIEDADPRPAVSLRKPQKIGRVIVSQDPGRRGARRLRRAPDAKY